MTEEFHLLLSFFGNLWEGIELYAGHDDSLVKKRTAGYENIDSYFEDIYEILL